MRPPGGGLAVPFGTIRGCSMPFDRSRRVAGVAMHFSPERKRRRRRALKRQEERWAAQSGPVVTYHDPDVVRRADQADGRDDRAVEGKPE